jgi:hypothetical protein
MSPVLHDGARPVVEHLRADRVGAASAVNELQRSPGVEQASERACEASATPAKLPQR